MGRVKHVKLVVDSFGSFLGMEKGCLVLRDKKGKTKKYPMFETEIGEVVLQSGNLVSTGVLSALGFWQIDVLVTTRNGYPIAMLKNLEDDAHVETRICQYEALRNGKASSLIRVSSSCLRQDIHDLSSKYLQHIIKISRYIDRDKMISCSATEPPKKGI
jgi:CRISPR/Cas system-associated endonuclease Cas1